MRTLLRPCLTRLFAALALFLVVTAAPAVARSANPAVLADAHQYAQDFGVSVDEALRVFHLQKLAGQLDHALATDEVDSFGGLYIEHAPFRVVALFTHDAQAALDRHLGKGPLRRHLEVRTVERTLAQLEAEQMMAHGILQRAAIEADSSIDVRTNRVEVYTRDGLQMMQKMTALRRQLPEAVRVLEVPELSKLEADIYGGLALSTCTSGWPVQNGSGTKGISTAGHCSNSQSYSGTALTYQSQSFGGSYDIQWHTTPGFTVQPKFNIGSSVRTISGTVSRGSQTVGGAVCKYGKTSGYGCGVITSKTYTSSSIPSSTATYIRVARTSGSGPLTSSGDSGGPWFLGNSAYGSHSGSIGNDAFYMAIDYLSGIGVSVYF